MKYALEDLRRIRHLREDAAKDAVIRARMRLEEAKEEVKKREKELEDYKKWREEEEKRLYDQIMKKAVAMKKLNDLKMTTSWLKERELTFEKKVKDAEVARDKAIEEEKKAHAAYIFVWKSVQRIEEHRKLWLVEAEKEAEMNEEKEIEDFHSSRFERTGDDDDMEFEEQSGAEIEFADSDD